jgi:hypothetical protein
MRGTKLKDTNEKSNTLTKHSHDCKGKWLFITKNTRSSKKTLCYTSSFLKGSFKSKKFEMDEPNIFF